MCTTIEQAQQDVIETFQMFADWTDRYRYLIELGRDLPPLRAEEMTPANRLHGCQAQVWLSCVVREGRLHLRAGSDAAIVAGLIALVLKVYSGRTPQEILDSSPVFVDAIGLSEHLSPNRANGLALMLARIRALAAQEQSGTHCSSA